MHPPISCMCLTFARPRRLLEEAVYSFLRQDYPGEKELLILNDFDQQLIRFDHPQVTVLNIPARFRTVGEKRNAAAALCRHDLLAVWDDDDIYLPHRLSFSAAMYDRRKRFFKPSRAFVLDDGAIRGPMENLFHAGSLWHRSLFDEVGGYRHLVWGEDRDIERRFQEVAGPNLTYDAVRPCEIFYLYRWLGTDSYHLSAAGQLWPDRTTNSRLLKFAQLQIRKGTIETGELRLEPRWHADYARLAGDYVAGLEEQQVS